jgi:hypothetical protein
MKVNALSLCCNTGFTKKSFTTLSDTLYHLFSVVQIVPKGQENDIVI